MIEVVEFRPEHVDAMRPQAAQWMPPAEMRDALAAPTGFAWTALHPDGHPLACAGVVEMWRGRGHAWALLGADSGPWFLQIHRAVRRGMALSGMRRIEMAVQERFPQGCRWAEMLGFRLETPEPMAGYFPDGRAAYLYARVT